MVGKAFRVFSFVFWSFLFFPAAFFAHVFLHVFPSLFTKVFRASRAWALEGGLQGVRVFAHWVSGL